MWYPGKRHRELRDKVERVDNIARLALAEARQVNANFNSRFADAIDKQFMFDEILECQDDILLMLENIQSN